MSIFTAYLGGKGARGKDGLNGLGIADIDAEPVNNQMLSLLFNNSPSTSAMLTASRDSAAEYVNRYGVRTWANAPSVTNYIPYSNDFTQWLDPFTRWSYIGATTDPFGGNGATEINLDVDTDTLGGAGQVLETSITGVSLGIDITISFWVKVISGDVSALDFVLPPFGTRLITLAPTDEWQQIIYPTCAFADLTGFAINPRGKTGARVALYQAQLDNSNTFIEEIVTSGEAETVVFDNYQIRQSDKGALLESEKTNIVHHSNDLSFWNQTNCSITQLLIADPFGHFSQNIKIAYGSLPNIELQGDTEPMTTGVEYNVSFYAYLTAGTMPEFSVELGGGAAVALPVPPVTGFQRFSVKCTAGADDTITFKASSPSLTAQLALGSIQIEIDDLTSYIYSCGGSGTRLSDVITFDYAYNFPAPNLPFTFSFKIFEMPNGSSKKYVFSNGLSGIDEFSLYYENENLVMNNGGNLASADMIQYNQVGLVYDGANLVFYGEREIINTVALANTATIATTVHIGSKLGVSHVNAYLSNFLAYRGALTHNNMLYLQGL